MSYRKSLAYRLMAERKINGLETVLVEGTEFLLGKHLPAHGGSQPWHCRMVGLTLVFWGASLTSSPPSAFWKQVHQLPPSLLPLKVLCRPHGAPEGCSSRLAIMCSWSSLGKYGCPSAILMKDWPPGLPRRPGSTDGQGLMGSGITLACSLHTCSRLHSFQ